jgi:hypothetical protein
MDSGLKFDTSYWFNALVPYVNATWTNQLYKCPAYKGPTGFVPPPYPRPIGGYGYNARGNQASFSLGHGSMGGDPLKVVAESGVWSRVI